MLGLGLVLGLVLGLWFVLGLWLWLVLGLGLVLRLGLVLGLCKLYIPVFHFYNKVSSSADHTNNAYQVSHMHCTFYTSTSLGNIINPKNLPY